MPSTGTSPAPRGFDVSENPVAVVRALLLSGGTLALLSVALPGGGESGRVTVAMAAGLLALGAALLPVRRLPGPVLHGIVAIGSSVIFTLVAASGGGTIAGLYAVHLSWIGVVCGLYFSRLDAALHLCLATVLCYASFAVVSSPEHAVLYTLLAMSPVTTGVVVIAWLVRARRVTAALDSTTGLIGSTQALREVLGRRLDRDDAVLAQLELDLLADLYEAFGVDEGDRLLRQVSDRLRQMTPGPDALARWGGESFLVVRPAGGPPESPEAFGERVLQVLHEPFTVGSTRVGVTGRVAVAAVQRGVDAEVALSQVTVTAGAARRARERVLVWDRSVSAVRSETLELLQDLRSAQEKGQLSLVYQPIVGRCGRVASVEALLRWNHPDHGSVPPGLFVPVAEQHGLIGDLTRWVLDTALHQVASWQAEGSTAGVAVNVSPVVLHDRSFTATVASTLARHRVPPALLTLEITETAVFEQPEQSLRALRELRAMGCRLSLDDFGTGYTSLVMLDELPLDEIKVDRAFIGRMLAEPARDAIAATIAGLGGRLGMAVVAEGIEDASTLSRVRDLGFDFAQGYFLGRPVPASDVALGTAGPVREELALGS